MNDATSFFLAFTATFALLAASLVRLELRARRIEQRLATLEAERLRPEGGVAQRSGPSGSAGPDGERKEGR
ncbi:MAG: hypothetical protein QOG31_1725 [Thermoplasmata archaeon]|nr:hypothetical protein [Thermoplasmata archaeon]